MVTPINQEGKLMNDSLAQLLELQQKAGVDGLFALGTCGEGPYLGFETKMQVVKVLNEHSSLPLIVHVGGAVFDDVLRLAGKCDDYDAVCGVSSVGPFYYRPDDQALLGFYDEISAVTEKPVYVYNNASRQGYNISPETFGRIASGVQGIRGIKDTSGDLGQMKALVREFGASHAVYGAVDSLLVSQLRLGARGHIGGIANIFPELFVQIRDNLSKGKVQDATRLQHKIDAVEAAVKEFNLEIAPYKELLSLRGVDAGVPVKPMRPLTEKERMHLFTRIKSILGMEQDAETWEFKRGS